MAARGTVAFGAGRKPAYDVVIVGAGPAGAATALALVRMGMSVAVLSGRRAAPAVGETVPPSIIRPLAKLGIWEKFLAAQHSPATSILVDWGGQRRFENDFLFNAYGSGWHLDRPDFDEMMVTAARDAGAEIHDCVARDCIPDAREGWVVSVRGSAGAWTFQSHWVVDASGRSAWLARRIGARRDCLDQLVSLVRFVSPRVTGETRTFIEACETGWWYAAALPGGRAVVAYFTDVDLLPRNSTERVVVWHRRFAGTSMIAETVAHPDASASKPHCVAARSSRALPCAGVRWIAVGDAAATWDPLSGQGIMQALTSALRAAEFIRTDDGTTLQDLLQTTEAEFFRYLQSRSEYYSQQTRWPNSPFWRRRRVSL